MISGVADLATDPHLFDVDDKHNLQSAGNLDETKVRRGQPKYGDGCLRLVNGWQRNLL